MLSQLGIEPVQNVHSAGMPLLDNVNLYMEHVKLNTVCSFVEKVVYATAVTKPGHGSMAPLAIGFTLFASAFVGKVHTFNN